MERPRGGWVLVGAARSGEYKEMLLDPERERVVEHLTEFRFHPWGNEHLSIFIIE